MKRDPYADLAEVYAEETSLTKFLRQQQPTAKTLTDDAERETSASSKWMRIRAVFGGETDGMPAGFHIDGDPRYQEQ